MHRHTKKTRTASSTPAAAEMIRGPRRSHPADERSVLPGADRYGHGHGWPMVKVSVKLKPLAGTNLAESWSAVAVTSRVPKAASRFGDQLWAGGTDLQLMGALVEVVITGQDEVYLLGQQHIREVPADPTLVLAHTQARSMHADDSPGNLAAAAPSMALDVQSQRSLPSA